MRRCLPLILLLCGFPAWGAGAAEAGAALLETDQAMNRDIMEQGNDTHAVLAVMDPEAMAFATSRHILVKTAEVYRKVPQGPSPNIQQSLYTEYAAVSASGAVGFTSGAWDTRFFYDSFSQESNFFYSYLVFGFNSGLWTATWSPRGAQRVLHFEYLRVWRRDPSNGRWRLIGGHFPVQRLTAPTAPPAVGAVVLPAPQGGAPTPAAARSAAMNADRALSEISRSRGGLAAYTQFAVDDTHFFRDYDPTTVGAADLRKAFVRTDSPFKLQPLGTCAVSGDLVCSYGYLRGVNDLETVQPEGIYVNLWRPDAQGWKLAAALLRH